MELTQHTNPEIDQALPVSAMKEKTQTVPSSAPAVSELNSKEESVLEMAQQTDLEPELGLLLTKDDTQAVPSTPETSNPEVDMISEVETTQHTNPPPDPELPVSEINEDIQAAPLPTPAVSEVVSEMEMTQPVNPAHDKELLVSEMERTENTIDNIPEIFPELPTSIIKEDVQREVSESNSELLVSSEIEMEIKQPANPEHDPELVVSEMEQTEHTIHTNPGLGTELPTSVVKEDAQREVSELNPELLVSEMEVTQHANPEPDSEVVVQEHMQTEVSELNPELLVSVIEQDVQTVSSSTPQDSELDPVQVVETDTNNMANEVLIVEQDPATQNGHNSSTDRQKRLCEICQKAPSKYTCPGCEMRTCSLPCVKDHKARLDCSGERIKTAFVDKSDYSDRHLLNDYRFLEDAERTFYSNKMVPENRHRVIHGAPYNLNKRSKLLVTAAQKRGIRLKMVSHALSKHKTNSSFYTISSNTIAWHVEWHFVTTNTVVKDQKVLETAVLKEAARKYTNFVQYPHFRKCLEDYKKEKLDECRFLLKIEGLPANNKKYFQLKPEASVAENLKGHCLVEYPTIFIVPPSVDDSRFSLLLKGDIAVMDPPNARHLAHHFPQFDVQAAIESELLNPKSHVYAP